MNIHQKQFQNNEADIYRYERSRQIHIYWIHLDLLSVTGRTTRWKNKNIKKKKLYNTIKQQDPTDIYRRLQLTAAEHTFI